MAVLLLIIFLIIFLLLIIKITIIINKLINRIVWSWLWVAALRVATQQPGDCGLDLYLAAGSLLSGALIN